MKRWIVVHGLVVFSSGASAGPVLLASLGVSGSTRYEGDVQEQVRFILDLGSVAEPGADAFSLVSPFVRAGDSVAIDFSNANTDDFAGFAGLITNDHIDDLRFFWNWASTPYPDSGSGQGGSIGEIDLSGSTLESVRLVIHDIRFEQDRTKHFPEANRFAFGVTYLFFGTTVPDPATQVLLCSGLGVSVFVAQERQGKRKRWNAKGTER